HLVVGVDQPDVSLVALVDLIGQILIRDDVRGAVLVDGRRELLLALLVGPKRDLKPVLLYLLGLRLLRRSLCAETLLLQRRDAEREVAIVLSDLIRLRLSSQSKLAVRHAELFFLQRKIIRRVLRLH